MATINYLVCLISSKQSVFLFVPLLFIGPRGFPEAAHWLHTLPLPWCPTHSAPPNHSLPRSNDGRRLTEPPANAKLISEVGACLSLFWLATGWNWGEWSTCPTIRTLAYQREKRNGKVCVCVCVLCVHVFSVSLNHFFDVSQVSRVSPASYILQVSEGLYLKKIIANSWLLAVSVMHLRQHTATETEYSNQPEHWLLNGLKFTNLQRNFTIINVILD